MNQENRMPPTSLQKKQKSEEISRLFELTHTLDLSIDDLAEQISMSPRSLRNVFYSATEVNPTLMRKLSKHLSASMDWLVTGKGAMFVGDDAPPPPIIAASPQNASPRHLRMAQLLADFLASENESAQAWLEEEMLFRIDTYRQRKMRSADES